MAVHGEAQVRAVVQPAAAFGRAPLRDLHRRQGCGEGRAGGLHVRATGWGPRAAHVDTRLESTLTLTPGTAHDLVVEIADHAADEQALDPERLWTATEAAWRQAMPELGDSVAPDHA
jgi:alpha,alpha-trehalase